MTLSEAHKKNVMKNAYKFNNSDSYYYRKHGLKDDMTKEERANDLEWEKEENNYKTLDKMFRSDAFHGKVKL